MFEKNFSFLDNSRGVISRADSRTGPLPWPKRPSPSKCLSQRSQMPSAPATETRKSNLSCAHRADSGQDAHKYLLCMYLRLANVVQNSCLILRRVLRWYASPGHHRLSAGPLGQRRSRPRSESASNLI